MPTPSPIKTLRPLELRPCNDCGSFNMELRKKTQSHNAQHAVAQCLNCGCRTCFIPKAHLALAVEDIASLPEVDVALREAYCSVQRSTSIELFSDPAVSPSWWERYEAHLASEKWAYLRAKVMTRSAGICEGCLEAPATAVHHLTYKHLGDELLWELVAVCDACHACCHPHLND